MHNFLPRWRVKTFHLMLVRWVRRIRRVLAHQHAINPIKRYVFLYVHIWLPGCLPPLELLGQADVVHDVVHYQTRTLLDEPTRH